jgi:hypothetical protein
MSLASSHRMLWYAPRRTLRPRLPAQIIPHIKRALGWGRSIADQALTTSRESRRPVERLLAQLGREQMRLGVTNPRTETWTSVFEQWHIQII